MIKGIGTDIVYQPQMRHILDKLSDIFINYTFTENERKNAETIYDKVSYYSGCYSVKEAYFKAVQSLLSSRMDFRQIELAHEKSGKPYIVQNSIVKEHMREAGIKTFHLSCTDDGDYTVTFLIAEGD